jgi:hypothetical protein
MRYHQFINNLERKGAPAVSSDVPATVFGLAAAATAFFPPETLWTKVAVIGAFVALSVAFLYLKHRENAAQEATLHALQKSVDDLVNDLRERDRQVLELQQTGRPKPLLLLEYDCDFEQTPEKPFIVRNVGNLPALNVAISPIQIEGHEATFDPVPNIPADAAVERLPDREDQGIFFRHRIRDLLDKAWHKNRWLPALPLSKPEIEKLFDQPLTFSLTVTYLDPSGQEHRGEFELVYIYFAARAFVRLVAPSPRAG